MAHLPHLVVTLVRDDVTGFAYDRVYAVIDGVDEPVTSLETVGHRERRVRDDRGRLRGGPPSVARHLFLAARRRSLHARGRCRGACDARARGATAGAALLAAVLMTHRQAEAEAWRSL